ncbi:MAG: hypothetical protein M3081_04710 [Gemmatimonadota bacterium]|nr:hypothetical protein [Gemmatimonadota bacterium]
MARPAEAQFGALRKLKNKVTGAPDSAAIADSIRKDSIRVATGAPAVLPDTNKGGQSMFQRAKNAASKASDKFEEKTGISAKDAALAASGAGVANLVAKKAGVADIAANAMSGYGKSLLPQGNAVIPKPGVDMSKLMPGMPTTPGVTPAMPAMPSMAAMQGLSQAGTGAALNAESAAMVEFQQELMDVAMKASTGDAAARARLDAWQALVVKYEPEMLRLSTGTAVTQADTPRKLMDLQLAMMNEWRGKRAPKKIVKP